MISKFEHFGAGTIARPAPPQKNAHHVSAEYRKLALAMALQRFRERKYYKICSAYGANRDAHMNDHFNRRANPKTEMIVWRPLITTKDLTRAAKIEPVDLPIADAYLIMDVYQSTQINGSWDLKFVYDTFVSNSHLIERHQFITWVGWYFNGPAGTICREGAWLRRPDGTVECRPDAGSEAYITDAVDWVHHSGCVDIATLDSSVPVGEYWLSWTVTDSWHLGSRLDSVSFSVTRNFVKTETAEAPVTQFVLVQPPTLPSWCPTWAESLATSIVSKLPKRLTAGWGHTSGLVSTDLLRNIRSSFRGRVLRSFTVSALEKEIKASMSTHPDTLALARCYPDTFASSDLVVAMMVHESATRSESLNRATFTANDALLRAHDRFTRLGSSTATTLKEDSPRPLFYAAFALIAGSLLLRLLRARLQLKTASLNFRQLQQQFLSADVQRRVRKLAGATLSNAFDRFLKLFSDASSKLLDAFESFLTANLTAQNVNYASMCAGLCIVTPLFEEAVRRIHKGAHYFILGSEVACHLAMGSFINVPVKFAVHSFFNSLPFAQAVVAHSAFNYAVVCANTASLPWLAPVLAAFWMYFKTSASPASGVTLATEFLRTFYSSRFAESPPTDDYVKPVPYPALESIRPRRAEHSVGEVEECPWSSHGDFPVTPEPECDQPTVFNLVFATNVIIHVPAKTNENILAATRARLLKNPPMDPFVQLAAWQRHGPFFMQLIFQTPKELQMDYDEVMPPWRDHFSTALTKKRVKESTEALQLNGIAHAYPKLSSIKVQGKWNEGQIKPYNELKPRMLSNVDPLAQALVGPYCYEATARMKTTWNGEHEFTFSGERRSFTARFRYAGADTDHDLSRWANRAFSNSRPCFLDVIISGDDSVVVYTDADYVVHVFEGDASMYDQSQSFGPLTYQRLYMSRLGVPQEILTAMAQLSGATLCVVLDQCKTDQHCLRISGKKRPQRLTGGSDTSFGNSWVMGVSSAFAIATTDRLEPEELAAAYAELGLNMKIKKHSHFVDATFLKGFWCPTQDDQLYWVPLPSRIFKMGKTVDPLAKIYPGIFKKRTLEDALPIAAYQFLSEVAHGYAFYCPTPFFDHFCRTFPLRDRNSGRLDHLFEYKIKACHSPKPAIDLDFYWTILSRRYLISADDLCDSLNYLPTDIFQFCSHPVFSVMARADYY